MKQRDYEIRRERKLVSKIRVFNEMYKLFKLRNRKNKAAMELYSALVIQARQPHFYRHWGIPDTPDGRYDMIMLHVFLVLHRLKSDHQHTKNISQALFDLMFQDMDKNLREMGVGDTGISRRVKQMAKAFYGRIAAYECGLGSPDNSLEKAIERNIYRNVPVTKGQVTLLCKYIRKESINLANQRTRQLLNGRISFDASLE